MKIHIRTLVRTISFSLAAVLVLSVFCVQKERELSAYRQKQLNEYRRAYWTLVASLESIETSLEKAAVCTSPELLALLSGDIWNKSETAEAALAELPVTAAETAHTSDFLNRAGSYAYFLASAAGRGDSDPDDVRDVVSALHRSADTVLSSLSALSPYIYEAGFFDTLAATEEEVQPTSWNQGLLLLESAFPETPTLLYDGPFSEHLTTKHPAVNQEQTVSPEELIQNAATLLGLSPDLILYEETRQGTIPTCHLSVSGASTISLTYSMHGGHLLSLLRDGDVSSASLSSSEAISAAQDFLTRAGYSALRHSYYQTSSGVLYINFMATEGDVTLYPDLIQVGISLADGTPVYFDATGYLSNHRTRSLPQPDLSRDEAENVLAEGLMVEQVSLALIPTDGKDERLCYEFLCHMNDVRYLIYIHAETGKEEKILILQENESGVLAF
ncbi:MAG: germination protein YpeB [Clostridia bacterium]|nr:germination protein YpeB [Clostridia bacterium]